MSEIINMISNAVIAKPKPAVYISGGLDSTIISSNKKIKRTDLYLYCKI